jgi:hypothetical protein
MLAEDGTGRKENIPMNLLTRSLINWLCLTRVKWFTSCKPKEAEDFILIFIVLKKNRAAVNFSDLMVDPNFAGESWLSFGKDSAELVNSEKEIRWEGPWFYSDSLVQQWKLRPGYVSVNSDTVMQFYKSRLDFARKNKKRILNWGEIGVVFLNEEPGLLMLDEKGYNPWRALMQLEQSEFYGSHDSIYEVYNIPFYDELHPVK